MACTYASAQTLLALKVWHVLVFACGVSFVKRMALVCSSTYHLLLLINLIQ